MEIAAIQKVFDGYQKPLALIFGIVILAGSLAPGILIDSGQLNLSAHQAQAFLQGRLDITGVSPLKEVSDYPSHLVDLAVFDGHYYVVQSPFASVVLMPFVAVFGIANTKPMLIAIVLTLLNVYLFIQVLKKINTQERYISWLAVAFFLGTGYWSVLRDSTGSWGFAQIVATTALLLALNEAFGKARGGLVGVSLGMAVLSRQNAIFYLIFLGVVLWQRNHLAGNKINQGIKILGLFAGLGLWIGFLLFLNWMRFGNPFDLGYEHLLNSPEFLGPRAASYGLFNLAYVPFNFIYMFIQGFRIQFDPNTSFLTVMGTDPFGTSLTFASPFLFIAFWAKWERNLLRAAWVSIGLILGLLLLYFSNGWVQVNSQRYTLDFIPIVILLVALGMQRVDERIWKGAIAYSVILNILSLFILPWAVFFTRL
jgi:hypothetical protein